MFLDVLRRIRGQAKLVGIGFGHQAMAQAFGGEVVRPSPGLREPLGFAIPTFQDQVVALLPAARVLTTSRLTPFAAIGRDDDTVSVQGHPEFSPAFCAALIEAERDVHGPLAGPALLSLPQPGNGNRAAVWLRQFITQTAWTCLADLARPGTCFGRCGDRQLLSEQPRKRALVDCEGRRLLAGWEWVLAAIDAAVRRCRPVEGQSGPPQANATRSVSERTGGQGDVGHGIG